jgi:diketogulonate reductase-like aldo/keto reductase
MLVNSRHPDTSFVLTIIPSPITQSPGGPLDKPLNEIAAKFGATTEQILLAWTKAKGAVVVT